MCSGEKHDLKFFCWISLESPNFFWCNTHAHKTYNRVRREHRRDVISFEHVLFWPCWHVACVPAGSQCKQTGCLACVTQKAHSNEMRPSQRQLSASRLNKRNDDVSPNRVIIPYVKRRETTLPRESSSEPGATTVAGRRPRMSLELPVETESCGRRCELSCVGGFDVLWCGGLKGNATHSWHLMWTTSSW